LTQVVIDGWYVNEIQPGDYKRLYISGGLISGGTYTSCSINPTPTMTPTPTQTPTPTLTPTQTNTFCSTKEMNPAGNATYSYYLCNGTLIQRVSDPTTYTACIRNNPGVIVFSGVVAITDLGVCS
jgi:hypothetical protein